MNSAPLGYFGEKHDVKVAILKKKRKEKRIGLTHLDDDTQAVLRQSFIHTGVLGHSGL